MQERAIRRRRWAAALAVAAALMMTVSACDWAQLGYGASRTYFNPTESAPAIGGIHEALHIEPPAETQGWPIVVGTTMITLSAGQHDDPAPASLRAYSTTDGTVLWTRQVSPATVGAASPAASNGTAYAAVSLANDGSSRVMAVSVADGSVRWVTTLPAVAALPRSTARVSGLAITSGRVVVERTGVRSTDPFYAGFTAGLDPATGTVVWTHASPYGFNYGTAIAGHTILHSMEKETASSSTRTR